MTHSARIKGWRARSRAGVGGGPVPNRWVLAPVMLGLLGGGLLPATAQGPAPAAPAVKHPQVKLILQQEDPAAVHHVLAGKGYEVLLRYQEELVGAESLLLDIVTVEPGSWKNRKIVVGEFFERPNVWVSVKGMLTNQPSPRITGRSRRLKSRVEVRVAGKTYEAKVQDDGVWEIPGGSIRPPLKDGTYDVEVIAFDEHGARGKDATEDELQIRRDETSPRPLPARPKIQNTHRFTRKFRLRPDAARKAYDQVMQAFTQAAEKEVAATMKLDNPPTEEQQTAKAAAVARKVRLGVIDVLNRFGDEYESKWLVLGMPKFASFRGNPENTLSRLFQWVELDYLLGHTKLSPKEGTRETDMLEMAEEIYDILLERERPPDQPFRRLSDAQLRLLRQGSTVQIIADFTPRMPQGDADRNWVAAPRVGFAPDAVATVEWSGRLAATGDGRPTQWLAFTTPDPDTEIDVQILRSADKLAWCKVHGREGWQYLRVVPLAPGTSLDFGVRLAAPDLKAAEVKVRSRGVTAAKFPF